MQSAQVNTAPNVNGAEIYGLRQKLFTGVIQQTVPTLASGGLKPNEGMENHPAFSWVSIVVILVVIRILQGMLPEA